MIRVVLDANQFVSALLKDDSNPARILALAEKEKILLVMSEPIIEEITAVLNYPKIAGRHGKTPSEVELFVKRMRSVAVMTGGKLRLDVIRGDPADNRYLECAVEGQAQFVVSGDHHLLDLRVFKGIQIVTPQAFLALFEDR